eukprot:3136789-Pleurochrysis_carterae.AAC.1
MVGGGELLARLLARHRACVCARAPCRIQLTRRWKVPAAWAGRGQRATARCRRVRAPAWARSWREIQND